MSNERQPQQATPEREVEKPTVNLATLVGEEREPLPEIDSYLHSSLEAAESAELSSVDEVRNRIYERRMEVLREVYQDAHDKRRLPGKIFRISEGSDEYIVASLAGRTNDAYENNIYFHNGCFWFENEKYYDLLDKVTKFLPDATNTNAVVSAYSRNLQSDLAFVDQLPGTYPIHIHAETSGYKAGGRELYRTEVAAAAGEERDFAIEVRMEDLEEHLPPSEYFVHQAYMFYGGAWRAIDLSLYRFATSNLESIQARHRRDAEIIEQSSRNWYGK